MINQSLWAEARAFHHAGQYAEAERIYLELLEQSPDNPQLLFLSGAVAFQQGKLDQAHPRLKQASVLEPENPNIWVLRAQLEEAGSNWDTALKFYDRILQLAPKELTALQRRAFVLEMAGEVDQASVGFRRALEASLEDIPVDNYSPLRNVYHCCTQKTASQWLRRLFSDVDFYKATGLLMQPYVQLGLNQAVLEEEWPAGTVVTHLYAGYDKFRDMPKPGDYKAFFILRDPRDCVVSWYHSARYSHNAANPILWLRQQLKQRSETEGYVFMIDWLEEVGFFEAQRSWINAKDEPNCRIYRYEALNRTPREFVDDLFDFLDVKMDAAGRDELCERHAWKKLSGGRDKGEQDIMSHYRKAKIGDWKDNFSVTTHAHFNKVTGDLVAELGYESD